MHDCSLCWKASSLECMRGGPHPNESMSLQAKTAPDLPPVPFRQVNQLIVLGQALDSCGSTQAALNYRLARGEAFDSDYSSNSSGSDSDDKYVDVGSSGSSDGGSSDFSDNDKDDFESTQGDSDIEVPEGAEKIYNENLRKHEEFETRFESII